MRGVIPPFSDTSLCRGDRLKNTGKTLPLPLTYIIGAGVAQSVQ